MNLIFFFSDEDPREALLKYAKVSEGFIISLILFIGQIKVDSTNHSKKKKKKKKENPLYLKAYQKTQPKPVFDEEEYEEEEAQRRS